MEYAASQIQQLLAIFRKPNAFSIIHSIPGAQRYLSSTAVTKWIGNVKEAPNPAILQGAMNACPEFKQMCDEIMGSAAPLQVPKNPFEDEEDQFVDDARLWQAFEPISVHQAARTGNLDNFKAGLEQSGEEMLFIADDVANATVLHIAAQNGHDNIVKYILETHPFVDVDSETVDGTTPLMMAIRSCHAPVVRTLLKHGAGKQNGHILLDSALSTDDAVITSLLIDHQQALELRSSGGIRPAPVPVVSAPVAPVLSSKVVVSQQTVNSTTTTIFSEESTSSSEYVAKLLKRIADLEFLVQKYEDENMCAVCMEGAVQTVLLDCGHLCLCLKCAAGPTGKKCPLCQKSVSKVVRIYRS